MALKDKVTYVSVKLKNIFKNQTEQTLLSGIAVIVLIIVMMISYVFNYMDKSYSNENAFYSWEYVYTNNAANGYTGEWNTADISSPVSSEKAGKYLHMRANIKQKADEQLLIVKTDYSPVKISINGEVAYNNHYDESEYVGNAYNAVTIPKGNGMVLVEISAELPFSAAIETNIQNSIKNPALDINTSFIFSVVLLAIGLVLLIASIAVQFSKFKNKNYFLASVLVILYAVTAFIFSIRRSSYLINFSNFYNLSIALAGFNIIAFVLSVTVLMKIKDKHIKLFLCFYTVLNILIIAAFDTLTLKIASLLSVLFSFITVLFIAKACKKLMLMRIQYSNVIFTAMTFLAMFNVLSIITLWIPKYRTYFVACQLVGEFILLCFIFYILAAKIISSNDSKNTDLYLSGYTDCVEKISVLIKEILAADSKEKICRIVADNVYDLSFLCTKVTMNNKIDKVAFSVSVKENGKYSEIYNKNFNEKINFNIIEQRYMDSGICCVFAQTYLDLIILRNNDIHIVFHFENIPDGFSTFFIGIMKTLYGCIDIAFSHLFDGSNDEEKKISVFTNLAQNLEINSGNNVNHLKCVSDYTKIILEELDYPKYICEMVSKAAILHDIGKIGIPFEIINKEGKFSEGERMMMNKHTEYGYKFLSAFDGEFMQSAAAIANDHHSPYSVKGRKSVQDNSINEYALVVSVADVFDALTSERSYKEAWSFDRAIEYINSNSGTIFSPKVVEALNRCVDKIKVRFAEKNNER